MKLPKPMRGRTHPTFFELQTNRRSVRASTRLERGERRVLRDTRRRRASATLIHAPHRHGRAAQSYEDARKASPQVLAENSPLAAGEGVVQLPRFFADRYAPPPKQGLDEQLRKSLASLNATGYWPATLPQNSYPYKGDGKPGAVAGDFASTHVGDESDTSPYNDTAKTESISTAEYLRNMNVFIAWLTQGK